MKKIDKDGLLLCKMQGDVFSSSLELSNTSSEIFIRRFMLSDIVTEFDSSAILDDTLTIRNIFDLIDEEYGKSAYGKVKYNKETLFWIGYIYRYMVYTNEISSRQAYRVIKPKELNELYYAYHTMDCSAAIDRIFEEKDISFDPVKMNEKAYKLLRIYKYPEYMRIVPIDSNQENNINLSIILDEEQIATVLIKKENETTSIFELILKDRPYNDELFFVMINQSIKYMQSNMTINNLLAKIDKLNESLINAYKKLEFKYKDEDNDSVFFTKKLNKK